MPSTQKTLRARDKKQEKESFSEGLREIGAIDGAKALGESFSGRLRNLVVVLCFLTIFVAVCKGAISQGVSPHQMFSTHITSMGQF